MFPEFVIHHHVEAVEGVKERLYDRVHDLGDNVTIREIDAVRFAIGINLLLQWDIRAFIEAEATQKPNSEVEFGFRDVWRDGAMYRVPRNRFAEPLNLIVEIIGPVRVVHDGMILRVRRLIAIGRSQSEKRGRAR